MTIENSSTTIATPSDFYDFCNKHMYAIWQAHALTKGIEAIVHNEEWESNENLCAASCLLTELLTKISQLAADIDNSTFDYISKPGTTKPRETVPQDEVSHA
jgi:hypothetical protein